MCGRFTNSEKLAQTALRLEAVPVPEASWEPSWNCAPAAILPVVLEDDRGRRLGTMGWGWRRDWKKGLLINARTESAGGNRLWSAAWRDRRCAIPCTGWWEWLREGQLRRLFHHHLADGTPFALAGLWERTDTDGVFVILTTAAVPAIAQVHDRMPVVLPDAAVSGWLADGALPTASPELALEETRPFGARDDGPELLRSCRS